MRSRARITSPKLGPEVFSVWNVETSNEIATLLIRALKRSNASELRTLVVQVFQSEVNCLLCTVTYLPPEAIADNTLRVPVPPSSRTPADATK